MTISPDPDIVAPGTAVAMTEAPATSVLNFVAMALKDSSIDVSKLEALLRMQREIVAEDAKAQFNRAFMRMQAKLPRVTKRGEVSYKGQKAFKFAKWEDMDTAIRPVLEAEGFSLAFTTAPRQGEGGGLLVTAILRHVGGHSTETSIPVPLDSSGGKNSLQGYGSTLSYGKRYATAAALNIVTEDEDDDGVRGGMRFISHDQAEELRQMTRDAGRDEIAFVQKMFGDGLHSFDEIEQGQGYLSARNTLHALLSTRKQKEG